MRMPCFNSYHKFILFLSIALMALKNESLIAQNVGIGTTTPQAKLEVMNSIRVGGLNKYFYFDSVTGRFNFINSKLGINNPSPQFPLTFNGELGDKISLWTDGGPTHYGFGIGAGLLQIFTNTFVDDVAFGYGSSTAFTENVRIKGNGNVGIGNNPQFKLDVSNRIRLRSGGDLTNSAGIWMNKTNNSNVQAFFGVENDTYAGIYGTGSFWSFGVNTTNGDVKILGKLGIGTTNPNAPLSFPVGTGKKIVLYPGGSGDIGFGVQNNLLQIFADHPNADIAFGYDQGGILNERFRMKGTGAFSVNGNTGTTGQYLQSNGDNAVPTWTNPTNLLYNNTVLLMNNTVSDITSSTPINLPGLNYTFTVSGNAKVVITFSIFTQSGSCVGCSGTTFFIDINLNGSQVRRYVEDVANNATHSFAGTTMLSVGPGTHTIQFTGFRFGTNGYMGHPSQVSNAVLQIIPQ